MTEIKLAEILNDHSWDLRDSLAKAVTATLGRDATFDEHDLFAAFEDAVRWRFRTWVKVSDDHVRAEPAE